MSRIAADESGDEPVLAVALIDALEAHGLPPSEYRLYEYVDVEALTQLVESADGLKVQVEVAGVPVRIDDDDGVTVLAEEPAVAETA